jgi:hypothetical protein
MAEAMTLIGILKGALESIHSVWKNGALLLWSCAVASLVAFCILNIAEYYQVNGAFELNRNYGIYLLLAVAIISVFAIFKTYAERASRPLVLIANEQRSHWGQAKQPSGKVFTAFDLHFQATNVSDGDVQLATAHLSWPWVRAHSVLQTVLWVQHPERETYGRYPILAHRLSPGTVNITVDRPVGKPGKRMRVSIKIQDHARRWYRLTFRNLRSI